MCACVCVSEGVCVSVHAFACVRPCMYASVSLLVCVRACLRVFFRLC